MNRVLILVISMICLSLWAGVGVCAADDRPCAADISKFCKDVKPGGGRILDCLSKNEKDLSPACRKKQQTEMMKVKEAHKACADDIDKFCKDVKPGGGMIMKCLKGHEAGLSTECKGEMAKAKKKKD